MTETKGVCTTFDTAETQKGFRVCVVYYEIRRLPAGHSVAVRREARKRDEEMHASILKA